MQCSRCFLLSLSVFVVLLLCLRLSMVSTVLCEGEALSVTFLIFGVGRRAREAKIQRLLPSKLNAYIGWDKSTLFDPFQAKSSDCDHCSG